MKAFSCSFLSASRSFTDAMRRARPPSKEITADIINKLRTVKKSKDKVRETILTFLNVIPTVRIAHVDKVETDDVVARVIVAGRRLVQAVDVEASLEHRHNAHNLIRNKNIKNTKVEIKEIQFLKYVLTSE